MNPSLSNADREESPPNPESAPMQIQRPPIPEYDSKRKFSLRKRMSWAVRRARTACYDALAPGSRHQKTHVVICGFPRSGTTLLLLIVESCVDNIRYFGKEISALFVAEHMRSHHEFLISKRTNDIYWVDEIRDAYEGKSIEPKFVLSMRDPRDVLTSFHPKHPGDYYVPADRWLSIYQHLCYVRQFPDSMLIRYEDIVANPQQSSQKLQEFAGWKWSRPIDSFHEAVSDEFYTTPLNGLRPLETKNVGRWQASEHRSRIQNVLAEIPQLPQYLIDEGYEEDDTWVRDYM